MATERIKIEKMVEPSTGIVHLMDPTLSGGEYTFCGIAWDEPATENRGEAMVDTKLPINCEECLRNAKIVKGYTTRALRGLSKKSSCGNNGTGNFLYGKDIQGKFVISC